MKWYLDSGPEGDVVISSRVRLARNLRDYPFPSRLGDEESKKVLSVVKEAAKPLKLQYLSMEGMPEAKRGILVESHLISPNMLAEPQRKGLLLSRNEKISVLLNEEDHIRIQSMQAGADLRGAYDTADKADDVLEESLDFGFSPQYGYTTCCPTNTGTGMRASCMLHLPALTASGYIENLLASAGKLGITIRGVYGEGTKAMGRMYQISNQTTLGVSEEDSLHRIEELVRLVAERERTVRDSIRREQGDRLTDRIYRAAGVLKSAYLLTSDEAYQLLSDLRLGISLGILKEIPLSLVSELTITIGSAHIADKTGAGTPQERDIQRARLLRDALSK